MMNPRTFARMCALTATIAGSVGCAHQQDQALAAQKTQLATVQARLDEAERTNGRLTVRIEELEDDVFLLQDRVDANRIALQRRGVMGSRAQAQAQQAPGPSPETYWGGNAAYRDTPAPGAPVTRIPLERSNDNEWTGNTYEARQPSDYREQVPTSSVPTRRSQSEDGEIVIGEHEFAEFERRTGSQPRKSTSSSSSSGTRSAQPDVTDQKLATTDEINGGEAAEEKTAPAPRPEKSKDALRTYKDALAAYRGGQYQEALGGFESFLGSSPRPDYMDNALYWIGECHFGLGSYDDAVSYFQRVMSEQPDGNKVPDAMLKMSIAYDRIGRGAEATRLLEDLTQQYPATNAGKLATQKLEERQ